MKRERVFLQNERKSYRNKANEEKPKPTIGKMKDYEGGEDKNTKSSKIRG